MTDHPAAGPPSITCPHCGSRSSNGNDIREGYCGLCQWWTSVPELAAQNPSLADAQALRERRITGCVSLVGPCVCPKGRFAFPGCAAGEGTGLRSPAG